MTLTDSSMFTVFMNPSNSLGSSASIAAAESLSSSGTLMSGCNFFRSKRFSTGLCLVTYMWITKPSLGKVSPRHYRAEVSLLEIDVKWRHLKCKVYTAKAKRRLLDLTQQYSHSFIRHLKGIYSDWWSWEIFSLLRFLPKVTFSSVFSSSI